MKFSQLENIMNSKGIDTLADIARVLESTPQAVSNWKARDRVPLHVVNMLNEKFSNEEKLGDSNSDLSRIYSSQSINLSDLIIIMAQQFKVLTIIPIIITFLSFTYIQFVTLPIYESSSTILLPDQKQNAGNFGGLASQFGIQMGNSIEKDLSSPSLYPDLIKSRMFAERMLMKGFCCFLTSFETLGGLSVLKVQAESPKLAQQINIVILDELQLLSRFYKSKKVKEKISFINNRINQVNNELEKSEQDLKIFRQQNQQIVSPALMLEQEKLTRESEVQKGVFLTLKQQLELAKIEEIQETSIMQILDSPHLPTYPINKNIKLALFLGLFFGSLLALSISFIRAYLNKDDQVHRRKIRKGRNYLRKKIKDLFSDRRVTGLISIVLIVSSPFYFGYQSKSPIFFGMYSLKLLIINSIYLIMIIFILIMFLKSKKQKTLY